MSLCLRLSLPLCLPLCLPLYLPLCLPLCVGLRGPAWASVGLRESREPLCVCV